jgi:hypothetical protein
MRTSTICLLMLFITGCSCDEQYLCPPLSDKGIDWIEKMHTYGDTIEYRNSLGGTFKFHFTSTEISPSFISEGCYRDRFKCYCESECSSYGNLVYEPEVSDSNLVQYRYWIDERRYHGNISSTFYSFNIFDLRRSINLNSQNFESIADSFYNSINIDGNLHNNIFVFAVDTNLEYYTDQKVWKSYISIEEGIVAFWERPSNTLFVRQ